MKNRDWDPFFRCLSRFSDTKRRRPFAMIPVRRPRPELDASALPRSEPRRATVAIRDSAGRSAALAGGAVFRSPKSTTRRICGSSAGTSPGPAGRNLAEAILQGLPAGGRPYRSNSEGTSCPDPFDRALAEKVRKGDSLAKRRVRVASPSPRVKGRCTSKLNP
jgi:hypothetical protein